MRTSDQEFFQYFPIAERDREWGLYVTGVGSTSVPPNYQSYPKSVHPDYYMLSWKNGRVLHEYQALYQLRGPGKFESKMAGTQKIEPGTLMLLFPGEWHRYRPAPDSGWDEYWVSFAGDHMDQWVGREFFSPGKPLLHVGVDDALLHLYQELIDQACEARIGFQQMAAANVHQILAAGLAAVRRLGMTDRNEEIVRQAKAILEQSVDGVLSKPALAKSFHLMEDHVRRDFKRYTGIATYE